MSRRLRADQYTSFQLARPVERSPDSYRSKYREAPACENCYRETEYLFDGFVLPLGEDMLPKKWERTVMALSAPFQTIAGMVCFRCRPPSNWEIQETLHAHTRQQPLGQETSANRRTTAAPTRHTRAPSRNHVH